MSKKISEAQATANMRLSLDHSVTCFRNNTGAYKQDGRLIKYGLGTGTSDFIGWTTQTITADMVGQSVAIFTAIEVKSSDGKLTQEQENFLNLVKQNGGIAKIYKGDKYV